MREIAAEIGVLRVNYICLFDEIEWCACFAVIFDGFDN